MKQKIFVLYSQLFTIQMQKDFAIQLSKQFICLSKTNTILICLLWSLSRDYDQLRNPLFWITISCQMINLWHIFTVDGFICWFLKHKTLFISNINHKRKRCGNIRLHKRHILCNLNCVWRGKIVSRPYIKFKNKFIAMEWDLSLHD